jgi:hypothetical protein
MGMGSPLGGAPPLFTLVFLLVLGVIVFSIIRAIVESVNNAKSPVITVEAKVISKRTHVSSHHHNHGTHGGMHHSSTTRYYVTFQTEHGERMELSLSGRIYGTLAEGDRGMLTYQGTWFKDFRRSTSLFDD